MDKENQPATENASTPIPVAQPALATTLTTPKNKTTNNLTIAAMVVGIIAIILGWVIGLGFIMGVIALILGIIGLKHKYSGKGMAITGIITGTIAIIWNIIITVLFILTLFASGKAMLVTDNTTTDNSTTDQADITEGQKTLSIPEWGVTGNYINKDDTIEYYMNNYGEVVITSKKLKAENTDGLCDDGTISRFSADHILNGPNASALMNGRTVSDYYNNYYASDPVGIRITKIGNYYYVHNLTQRCSEYQDDVIDKNKFEIIDSLRASE